VGGQGDAAAGSAADVLAEAPAVAIGVEDLDLARGLTDPPSSSDRLVHSKSSLTSTASPAATIAAASSPAGAGSLGTRSRRGHTSLWCVIWYSAAMEATRKITVELPRDLLRKAQRSTGEGITATVRRGLELVAAGRAYEELRRLKGKVALSIDLDTLREDR
jgi:hypothetical protein